MKNYFGFIDETGVLSHDPGQRFFAIGLLKCADTTALYEQMYILKNKAEAKLELEKRQKGNIGKANFFEFKIANITKGSSDYYFALINQFFKFPQMQFSCIVIDKNTVRLNEFSSTWDAYIEYSKKLIAMHVKADEKICIIADFMGKPKSSNKFYELQIRQLPYVYNATVLESHASLYIQLVDVLVGCVVFDFKRERQSEKKYDEVKLGIGDFLRKKLGVNNLLKGAEGFKVTELME